MLITLRNYPHKTSDQFSKIQKKKKKKLQKKLFFSNKTHAHALAFNLPSVLLGQPTDICFLKVNNAAMEIPPQCVKFV